VVRERAAGGGGAVAVVWFVVGLAVFDMIYFYPPIVFVVGMVAVVRGLIGEAR
jgi:hypothetical protein